MDQIKIGKFIAKMRKEKDLTQEQLAEKLNITDRAISKWENGINMPDAGTIPLLCNILDISINDLFSGEKVAMENNNKKLEENLIALKKESEAKDKKLLNIEILISIPAVIISLSLMFIASYVNIPDYIRIILIALALILIFSACFIALFIEQKAGYYECGKCHYKYVPTYAQVLFALHINRTRYMKCPKCAKRTWNKKVISK